MKSFLNRKIHFIFWLLFFFFFLFSLYLFLFFLILIYGILLFYFRLKNIAVPYESELVKTVLVAPVTGVIKSIGNDGEFQKIKIVIPWWKENGIFCPLSCEVKDVNRKIGLAQYRYKNGDLAKEYSGHEVVLEDKKNNKVVLEFIQCTIGMMPKLWVSSGDRAKNKANIGFFPFGGTLLVRLPSHFEIAVRENDAIISGETVLAGIPDGNEHER